VANRGVVERHGETQGEQHESVQLDQPLHHLIAMGSPSVADVVELLQEQPMRYSETMEVIHRELGNSFANEVLTALQRTPSRDSTIAPALARRSDLDQLRRDFGLETKAQATPRTDASADVDAIGPIDVPHRVEMEKRFNRSFADVRAYVGQRELLGELGARAATKGDVIIFADESPEAELVAHELTHVAQQSSRNASSSMQSSVASEDAAAEIEAESNADLVGTASEDGQHAHDLLEGSEAPTAAIHLDRGTSKRRRVNKVKTPVGLPEALPPSSLAPPSGEKRVDGEGNEIALHNGHWHLTSAPKSPAFPIKAGYKPSLLPINPNASYQALLARVQGIRLEQLAIAEGLRGDMKYWFAKVYYWVTTRELEFIAAGTYQYPHMKLQEVIAFHTTYRTNLDAWQAGNKAKVEAQWRAAFAAAEDQQGGTTYLPRSAEILFALLPSMQAHIRIDLPRAIAACFVTHYAGIPGASMGDFRPDFDAMGPVFDMATEDVRGEIGGESSVVDPGSWGWAQNAGFPFVFGVGRERQMAWEKSNIIAKAMAGGDENADTRSRLKSQMGARHPNADAFDVDGTSVVDKVDWMKQPGMKQDQDAPKPTYEAASSPPPIPAKLFFKHNHPLHDSEKIEDAIRDDQDLAALVELAAWTRTVRGAHIHFIGQASDEGTEQHNKQLSAYRTFAVEYFLFKCGADLTNNKLTIENRGEDGASKGSEFRFVDISIKVNGTGRQQHHTPNNSLPSEVAR
jgi:hypothetical protein